MLNNIYNQRVTILNKFRRGKYDNKTNTDLWYKTVIDNAAWYTASARSAGGSSVYIGSYITVLIPFHDNFLPYREWKKKGMQEGHFTISVGDYVVLGDVPEDVTASNIIEVLENYGEDVCTVKHHNSPYDRFGARVQLKIQGV